MNSNESSDTAASSLAMVTVLLLLNGTQQLRERKVEVFRELR